MQVKMEIIEKKMVIDEAGTEVWAFTYNGTVPGPMIVAHQGDYIELKLVNKSQKRCKNSIIRVNVLIKHHILNPES